MTLFSFAKLARILPHNATAIEEQSKPNVIDARCWVLVVLMLTVTTGK